MSCRRISSDPSNSKANKRNASSKNSSNNGNENTMNPKNNISLSHPPGGPAAPGIADPAALAKQILGGGPVKKALRGIQKAEGSPELFIPDPARWPVTAAGEPVPQVCWGGVPHPLHRANLHFLVAGVPGTGKTLSIRMLLQSIFGSQSAARLPGSDRAVIYDPKLEFYPIFRGMGVEASRINVLNPFDARSTPWDLAADYNSPSDAHQLARTIIPTPESHSQPFFPKSAAALLAAVISVCMRRMPGAWDLAEVLMRCLTTGTMEETFAQDPANPYVVIARNLLKEGTTRDNVLAELTSHLFEYLPIAACWRRARQDGRKPVSVKEFLVQRDAVILLGANQTHSEALGAINRLFLKRLAEHTLDHVADGQWQARNRTWLVLDETRELGKIPGLADFINKGRSRGVCAVLGFQDYAGMKQAFGENVAHELTATCAHKLFLRLGAESAEWASRSIGKCEVRETHFSRTDGVNAGINVGESSGTNWNKSASGGSVGGSSGQSKGAALGTMHSLTSSTTIRESDAVMPSEIAHLPGFEEGGGLRGFLCQNAGAQLAQVHQIAVPLDYFMTLSPPSDDPGFMARSEEDQDLFRLIE
jgi:DNA polymerase III delta prime subunit